MSTLISVKQIHRQGKSARPKVTTLVLTPDLVSNAQTLVSIYDHVDWDEVVRAECDLVNITFQSARSDQEAYLIHLEMAAGDQRIRNELVSKIRRVFQKRGFPLHPDEIEKKSSKQNLIRGLLETLADTDNPIVFAKTCFETEQLYHKINSDVWKKYLHRIKVADVKPSHPMAPPTEITKPSWFGPIDEKWISVPTRLVFAETLVGLCRRITEINTDETNLLLEAKEQSALQLHRRFLVEVRPLSYRIPPEEPAHPYSHRLQQVIDKFIPALQKLICNDYEQNGATKSAVLAQKPITPTELSARSLSNMQTDPNATEMHSAQNKKESRDTSKLDVSRDGQETKQDLVRIEINRIMAVRINREGLS